MRERLTKKNQSVDKMFQIIEVMAQSKGSMRLQDISIKVGQPASTVLRMLNSLISIGYIDQNLKTRMYSLSFKFCRIGEAVRSQFSIRELIRPFIVELSEKCQESTCLAIEQDMSVVYIDVVEGPDNMLRTLQRIGKSAPMHSTGVGKLMLTSYDSKELDTFIKAKGLQALTNKTITKYEDLLAELDNVRELGYALDDEECEIGARCIAAPIKDYTGNIVACISVSGPTSRMNKSKINKITKDILMTAENISTSLGYSDTSNIKKG